MLRKNIGPICTFLGASFFALGGLFMKIIPWQALQLNAARCSIAIIYILIICKFNHHKFKISKSIIIAGVSITGTNILYSLANKMTTAANAIILQYTCPIFVILISLLFFKKKPSKHDLLACAFVFIGVIFFFVDGLSLGNTLGNILALISGLTYAGVFLGNNQKDSDPMSATIVGASLSALIGIPSLFSGAPLDTSPKTLILILCFGVFQLGCGYLFLGIGLQRTPAVAASLISGVEAILNPILVAIFYHEYITPIALIGAAIVFITIMVYNVVQAKGA